MKRYKHISTALLFGLISLVSNPASANPNLVVSHAWVREAPPGASVQAGYMELRNNSSQIIKISAISSPEFASIEMHRMFTQDGMMRMQQQDTLNIPANGMLRLEPGSYHLMLLNPVSYLNAGNAVRFTLTTASGTSIDVNAIVKTDNGS